VARELGFKLVGTRLQYTGVTIKRAGSVNDRLEKDLRQDVWRPRKSTTAERMTGDAGRRGFAATATMEDADVVLLNTCHLREKAAEKVYSDLGRIRQV